MSGFLPLRSMAWFSSRKSSKSSTRSRSAVISACRTCRVSFDLAARFVGFSMTLLISFLPVFHCIHLNLFSGETEKHAVIADAQTIFVLYPGQLLDVALKAGLQSRQP